MLATARLSAALFFLGFLLAPMEAPRAELPPFATASAGEISEISEEAFEQMLEDSVTERGGAKVEQGDTLRVELAAESTVMFFTRPTHPAHPAIVSVRVVREEGVPHLFADGWRAGNTTAFEVWFTGFMRQNEGLARQWQEDQASQQ